MFWYSLSLQFLRRKKNYYRKKRYAKRGQSGQQGLWTIWRKSKLKHNLSSFIGILMLNSCISLVICVQKIYMQQQKKIKTTKQKHWYINFVSNTITSVSHFVIKLRSTAVKDPSICISIKNEFWMVQPNLYMNKQNHIHSNSKLKHENC